MVDRSVMDITELAIWRCSVVRRIKSHGIPDPGGKFALGCHSWDRFSLSVARSVKMCLMAQSLKCSFSRWECNCGSL